MTGVGSRRAGEPSIVGIFVGGRSSRMGGVPKGLLESPETGEPLVVALVARVAAAGLEPVLVGAADGYVHVVTDVPRLADDPAGVGPLGGLRALLRHAGPGRAIAVGCDMPYVTAELLAELAGFDATAPVLAARGAAGLWEPLLARYDCPLVLPELERALAAGERSFQRLLSRLDVAELALTDASRRALADWDTPADRAADLSRGRGSAAR